jgi:NAD(P)-dependent dehydrogenase (short-subunit alcohol dehydrogenase family)
VTGANVGIGFAAVRGFAKKSPERIILASRNEHRIDGAIEDLKVEFPSVSFTGSVVDLSSFRSIETFVETISHIVDRIDILVDNAGVFLPKHSKTEEGFEVTLGVNTMGTVYLTNKLIPLLSKSPAARVVILISGFVYYISGSYFDSHIADVGGETWGPEDTGLDAYAFSKLLLAMYASELQERLHQDPTTANISVFSVHPGVVNTDILNKADKESTLARLFSCLHPFMSITPEVGALSTLYCATSDKIVSEGHHGKMFSEGPYVQISAPPSFFTRENCAKAYDAIQATIDRKLAERNHKRFE